MRASSLQSCPIIIAIGKRIGCCRPWILSAARSGSPLPYICFEMLVIRSAVPTHFYLFQQGFLLQDIQRSFGDAVYVCVNICICVCEYVCLLLEWQMANE